MAAVARSRDLQLCFLISSFYRLPKKASVVSRQVVEIGSHHS
jgi:hypothetical protein